MKLCSGFSNQEINNTLAELNSVELWKNDKIGLRLWAVKKFPYSCSDGEISDISGHVVRSRKKTNIDGIVEDNMIFERDSVTSLVILCSHSPGPFFIAINTTIAGDAGGSARCAYDFPRCERSQMEPNTGSELGLTDGESDHMRRILLGEAPGRVSKKDLHQPHHLGALRLCLLHLPRFLPPRFQSIQL